MTLRDHAGAVVWLIDAPVGTRVRLVGQHPWAGQRGVVVRWERPFFAFSPLPVVLMDNGEETYVRNAEEWRSE